MRPQPHAQQRKKTEKTTNRRWQQVSINH